MEMEWLRLHMLCGTLGRYAGPAGLVVSTSMVVVQLNAVTRNTLSGGPGLSEPVAVFPIVPSVLSSVLHPFLSLSCFFFLSVCSQTTVYRKT